ncbi:MAG TPA: aminotransferase class V-fold PLP-dependent enzyme [Verrucomicrobiae bacterium]|nr:aminotransferase class V-fold PLP-dependent enzyme [Verrucomicrobiae bacterium]
MPINYFARDEMRRTSNLNLIQKKIALERGFSIIAYVIYLDHNATTPLLPEVFEEMKPYFTGRWGNPSSSYRFGSELRGVVEAARGQVAELIGSQINEVVFTGNATEANNTAIHAALKANPQKRHIITSRVEHSSVLNYCLALEKEGFRVTYLSVDRNGLLDLTAVASLMWVNNETGVLFPILDIGRICRARGVLFHCDAVQAVGKLPINVSKLPIDYLSLTGHKLGAPKGVGSLYVYRRAPLSPLLHGGHQERGRRGGTENVALIAGLGKAAEIARDKVSDYERRLRPMRDALEEEILGDVPEAELNGHKAQRIANTTNISFRGLDSDALLMLLDQEGICASSGSACLADSQEASHVITAMKPELRGERNSLRLSLGLEQNPSSIQEAARIIKATVIGLRSL